MALNALLYSGIAGIATLLGISVVLWKHELSVRYSHFINSFAAGALITIALIHLIPESVELVDNSLLVVFITFIGFYLLETVLVFHSGSAIHAVGSGFRESHSKGPVIFSGLFLHSLIDGFIIAVGFEISLGMGLFTAAGVILHELPEGITSFALLVRSVKKSSAIVLSIAVALATPIGAAIALGPLHGITEMAFGTMMAVAGGSFLYIAASDLIPETHEKAAFQNAAFFLVGAGLFYVLSLVFG